MTRNRKETSPPIAASIAFTLALFAVCLAAEDLPIPNIEQLAWMEGCWGSVSDGSSADECWSAPRGDTMVGFHIDVSADSRVFYEYLRILETDQGIIYFASPLGREPTPFALVSLDTRKAVFENPDHDWPQRLTYYLEGDVLHAVAAGLTAESRTAHWVWPRRHGPAKD